MDFNGVPKGKVIPVYLTDEGNLHPIFLHSEEELDLIENLIGGLMDYKVVVDPTVILNDPKEKISILNRTNKKN
jgi:hypothetical protein